MLDGFDYTIIFYGNVPLPGGTKQGSSRTSQRPQRPLAGIHRQAKSPLYQRCDERFYTLAAGFTTRSVFFPLREILPGVVVNSNLF